MALTTAEQRFAAYFAMGWGTEASKTKSPYIFTPAYSKPGGSSGGISLGVYRGWGNKSSLAPLIR